MKKFAKILGVLLVLGFVATLFESDEKQSPQTSEKVKQTKPVPKKSNDEDLVEKLKKEDCAEFIECLSAKEVAKEYGKTELWALSNYEVNVWQKTTTNGKGKTVGKMRCGSRALILDKNGDDFKILSPLDKSIGWVNKVQIAKTLYQNPNTFEK